MLRLIRQHGVGEARMWIHTQGAETLVVPVIVRRILTNETRRSENITNVKSLL